jgi:hypothetical protein
LPKMWCSPSCRDMWWKISHTNTTLLVEVWTL